MNGSMVQSVRDVCMSHQSSWIYCKRPIKFLVFVARNVTRYFLLNTFVVFHAKLFAIKTGGGPNVG